MFCATVLYPYRADKPIDVDYYAATLAPLYAGALGSNCVRFEVGRGLLSPGRPAPGFALAANFWVRSGEDFRKSMGSPGMQDVMKEIASFTDIEPIRQFEEVVDSPVRSS